MSAAGVFSQRDRESIVARLRAARVLAHIEATRPAWLIEPHANGQIQALSSTHKNRVLIPGNGWGKTTCMGMDVDFLMQGDDPFKPGVIPPWPATAVWFCQKFQQFEIMRPQLEGLFTRGYTWHAQHKCYRWKNGARLFILSSDSDWTAIQGVELDAVYFDEHPDRAFWAEMQYRRRGKKKTRYMVAATMTQGITWFVHQLIKPWQKWQKDRGRRVDEYASHQDHPNTFLWDHGGITDNPSMTEEDAKHYVEAEGLSDKEKAVRLAGGYADFIGEAVFDGVALEAAKDDLLEGVSGSLVWRGDEDKQVREQALLAMNDADLQHRFGGLIRPDLFRFVEGVLPEGGRVTIYEWPDREHEGNYVMGLDGAAGLVGKDYDVCWVARKDAGGRLIQVAEAEGHWGDVFLAETVYALGSFYYEAFLCGERQFALPTMRRLYDEMGYTYQYCNREEAQRARRMSDRLGHHRAAGDTVIGNARVEVKRRGVVVRSIDTWTQLSHYQFRPKNKTDVIDDVEVSSGLTTGAPSGENDDLVMGCVYAIHAAREQPHFPKPRRQYARGTFGDVMRLDETLQAGQRRQPRDPYAIRRPPT